MFLINKVVSTPFFSPLVFDWPENDVSLKIVCDGIIKQFSNILFMGYSALQRDAQGEAFFSVKYLNLSGRILKGLEYFSGVKIFEHKISLFPDSFYQKLFEGSQQDKFLVRNSSEIWPFFRDIFKPEDKRYNQKFPFYLKAFHFFSGIKAYYFFPMFCHNKFNGYMYVGSRNILDSGVEEKIKKAINQVANIIDLNLYRSIIDNAKEGVVITQDNTIKFVNKRVEQFLGTPLQNIVFKSIFDFIYEEDKAIVAGTAGNNLSEQQAPETSNFRIKNKQGEIVWVQNTASVINFEGRPARVNFITDISSLKKVSEELSEQKSILHEFLELANVMFLVLNQDTTIDKANKATRTFLGYESEEELKNIRWIDTHVPEEQRALVYRFFKGVFSGDPLLNEADNQVLTKEGKKAVIHWHNSRLINEQGEVKKIISVGHDVTEKVIINKAEAFRNRVIEELRKMQPGMLQEKMGVILNCLAEVLEIKENQTKMSVMLPDDKGVLKILASLGLFPKTIKGVNTGEEKYTPRIANYVYSRKETLFISTKEELERIVKVVHPKNSAHQPKISFATDYDIIFSSPLISAPLKDKETVFGVFNIRGDISSSQQSILNEALKLIVDEIKEELFYQRQQDYIKRIKSLLEQLSHRVNNNKVENLAVIYSIIDGITKNKKNSYSTQELIAIIESIALRIQAPAYVYQNILRHSAYDMVDIKSAVEGLFNDLKNQIKPEAKILFRCSGTPGIQVQLYIAESLVRIINELLITRLLTQPKDTQARSIEIKIDMEKKTQLKITIIDSLKEGFCTRELQDKEIAEQIIEILQRQLHARLLYEGENEFRAELQTFI